MSDQEAITSPSEMLRYFDDALEQVLPDGEYAKLQAHDAAVAATTSRHDFRRCLRCAEWAVGLTAEPGHAHLGHKLRGVLHELRQTSWATDFGIMTPSPTVTSVELAWIDDAVEVAQKVAEQSGWEAVAWEDLLVELIAMEPSPS